MHWTTLTSAFAVLAPTASASTKYGCWSEVGPKFHESCIVAITALVASRSYIDHSNWVDVPAYMLTYTYGNCRAELFAKNHGYSVKAQDILSSYGQLAARCQNGWFYYDNGWLGGAIGGRAGWKRDGQDNTTISHPDSISDFAKDNILQWEEEFSPKELPQPDGFIFPNMNGTTKTGGNNKRQHARDLTTRAVPIGLLLQTRAFRRTIFKLYRGTGYHNPNQRPASYEISLAFYSVIGAVVNDVKSNRGTGIIRNGLAQPVGSGVNALALAAQLNSGAFDNWDALAKYLDGEALSMMTAMMGHALQDMVNNGWSGAVYHVYNEYNVVLFTFIFNGVSGLLSALPRN